MVVQDSYFDGQRVYPEIERLIIDLRLIARLA
jgi:hypothetical protein